MESSDSVVNSIEFQNSTSATVAVIAVTLLVYFIYILWWKLPDKAEAVNPGDRALLLRRLHIPKATRAQNKYTTCTSPDCVRCQKYEIVKAEALQKLSEFKKLNGSSGLDRISASLLDLKSLPAEPLQKPNVLYVPGLRSQPFWSSSGDFIRETNLLERQWGFIEKEFKSVYEHLDVGWVRNNTETGSWSAFYFYNQGGRINENCLKCPRTVAIIESLSSFMNLSLFGNAFFSVLDQETVVSEHCGPCNIRIRCHLGLAIPEKTNISVGGQTQGYNLGCCIYFDDSFVHSSTNLGTKKPRAVLLLDLWHPDLTIVERDALTCVFPTISLS